jgi:hypothetical protein
LRKINIGAYEYVAGGLRIPMNGLKSAGSGMKISGAH